MFYKWLSKYKLKGQKTVKTKKGSAEAPPFPENLCLDLIFSQR